MEIILLGAFVLFLDWMMSSKVSDIKSSVDDVRSKVSENNRMLEALSEEAYQRKKFIRDNSPMGE